ncbi:MAG: DUF4118 domain-containing protein, partial [Candidatus Rokuibacteriota bacterium]
MALVRARAALVPATLALVLATITATIALGAGDPGSPLRHAYLLPVVLGALRFGALGGVLGAGAAILLLAPIVLPEIERSGLTPEALEGLVTLGVLALVGVLGGALTTRAGRLRARYEAILVIQRALAEDVPLELALSRLRAALARRLRASDVGLVVRAGERLVVAGAGGVAAGSVAARVLA